MRSAQCTVWSVKCEVYSFQCVVLSVQCAVWSVQYAGWNVQCIRVYSSRSSHAPHSKVHQGSRLGQCIALHWQYSAQHYGTSRYSAAAGAGTGRLCSVSRLTVTAAGRRPPGPNSRPPGTAIDPTHTGGRLSYLGRGTPPPVKLGPRLVRNWPISMESKSPQVLMNIIWAELEAKRVKG